MRENKWAELPTELLTAIGDRLGLIELLRFRSVCKVWNSASETATAVIESSPDRMPWFILYGCGENSQCILVHESLEKYELDIPEMSGTKITCIASKDGWLLLHQKNSPMSFFCPISGARIELPQLPVSKFTYQVAAFSSPPTSEDCIVAFIGHRQSNEYGFKLELYLLRRGENAWTRYAPDADHYNAGQIKSAAFHKGAFHFLDVTNMVKTFTVDGAVWDLYQREFPPVGTLRFISSDEKFIKRDIMGMMEKLDLEAGDLVSICGTICHQKTYDEVILHDRLIVYNEDVYELRKCKGVWIQPRLIKISPEFRW